MSYTTRQMIQALERQREAFTQEFATLDGEQRRTQQDLEKVRDEIEAAWSHLGSVLVPDLDNTTLDAAAAAIQLREINATAMASLARSQQARLRAALAELESNERFIRREALRNEASIRLAEVNEAAEVLSSSLETLEKEPLFEEIIRSGYGTERYEQRFWQLSYYRHWKHADLVVDKHGPRLQVADFAGIRRKYLEEKDALRPLLDNQEAWRRTLQDIDRLEQVWARTTDELTNLQPRLIAWARGRVREHLQSLPQDQLTQLVQGSSELRLAVARVLGSEAKRAYLEQLLRNVIQPPLQDLRTASEKAARDLGKLRRPKNHARTWSDSDFQRRFGKDRSSSWSKRRLRIQQTRQQVAHFHDYDRWDPVRDFLWWDLMTDGRLDGDFIREVHERGRSDHAWRHEHAAVAAQAAHDDLSRDIS